MLEHAPLACMHVGIRLTRARAWRVDGLSKADGVKGETIVDLQPSTVVMTDFAGYPRDTRLLLLHNKRLVDAVVLHWLGKQV